jgi:hypothetical protein
MIKVLFPLLVLATLSGCVKDSASLCSTCPTDTALQQVDEGKVIIDGVFADRLNNWMAKGHCDTCYTQQVNQCQALANNIIVGNVDASLCDSLIFSFKNELLSALSASVDVSIDLDSAEVADARTRFVGRLSEISNCR